MVGSNVSNQARVVSFALDVQSSVKSHFNVFCLFLLKRDAVLHVIHWKMSFILF